MSRFCDVLPACPTPRADGGAAPGDHERPREMLAEKNVGDISLRELSDRVGLAKSNVLRYFDSREAIFLEVLDEEFATWLSDIEDGLGRPTRKPGYANEIRVATVIADSVLTRPLLGELLGSMAAVLERNISHEFARDFKARAMQRMVAEFGTLNHSLSTAARPRNQESSDRRRTINRRSGSCVDSSRARR